MHIGFVTCQENLLKCFFPTAAEPTFISPEPSYTPDDYLVVTALRDHGHTVSTIIWGVPPSTLHHFDMIIVRSPWDYATNNESKLHFQSWLLQLEEANLPVQNSPALMRWLLDKHYLQDFADKGVSIIPTRFLGAKSTLDLAATFNTQGPLVLKQCISAGGAGLFFIDSLAAAKQYQSEFNQQLHQSDYMLQPLIPEISTHGEWSCMFFGGHYSHSLLKKPPANSIMVHAERGGTFHFNVMPDDTVVKFAKEVVRNIPERFNTSLYLRIDVIETKDGAMLIECEGVEPELFFRAKPGAEHEFRLAVEYLHDRRF